MSSFSTTHLQEELAKLSEIENSLAIFCLATYGEGDPTDNAQEFFDWLQDGSCELPGVNYAVSLFHFMLQTPPNVSGYQSSAEYVNSAETAGRKNLHVNSAETAGRKNRDEM